MPQLLSLLFLLLVSFNCFSQKDSASVSDYRHQLELIDSLRSYLLDDLKMKLPEHFYQKWQNGGDSMYAYLYISKPDTIQNPFTGEGFGLSPYEEEPALRRAKALEQQGYHTLIYKTAGRSDAKLNHKLLSYPDEAIAFIVFHEAAHYNIRSRSNSLPYIYEEAGCDAFANLACLRFSTQSKMFSRQSAAKQKRIFESAYTYLNKKRSILDHLKPEKRQTVLAQCHNVVSGMVQHGNQFQKDRMGYQVNNAYFLRVAPYALHYFELKKTMEYEGNLLSGLKAIEKGHLPPPSSPADPKMENKDPEPPTIQLPPTWINSPWLYPSKTP